MNLSSKCQAIIKACESCLTLISDDRAFDIKVEQSFKKVMDAIDDFADYAYDNDAIEIGNSIHYWNEIFEEFCEFPSEIREHSDHLNNLITECQALIQKEN